MAASSNPMVEFLTAPENVKAVLEILRNQREIQRQLALRFWKRFQESLESAKPPEFNLLFKNDIERRDDVALEGDFSGLDAAPPGTLSRNIPGLKYRVEINSDYLV